MYKTSVVFGHVMVMMLMMTVLEVVFGALLLLLRIAVALRNDDKDKISSYIKEDNMFLYMELKTKKSINKLFSLKYSQATFTQTHTLSNNFLQNIFCTCQFYKDRKSCIKHFISL